MLAAGVAGAVAFGVALGIAQGESVVRWIAYMLYVAGAIAVGFAFLTGAPESPRKLARQRLLKKDEEPTPEAKPFASELLVLVTGGAALFCLGALVELAL